MGCWRAAVGAKFAALGCLQRRSLLAMHPSNVPDDRNEQKQNKRYVDQCRVIDPSLGYH